MEDIVFLCLPGFFPLHPGEAASKSQLLTPTCNFSLLQAVGWENMAFIFLNRFLDLTDVGREVVPRGWEVLPVTSCVYLMAAHSAAGNRRRDSGCP